MTKLKHADSKQTIDVREDQVEEYATQGWHAPESKKDDEGK